MRYAIQILELGATSTRLISSLNYSTLAPIASISALTPIIRLISPRRVKVIKLWVENSFNFSQTSLVWKEKEKERERFLQFLYTLILCIYLFIFKNNNAKEKEREREIRDFLFVSLLSVTALIIVAGKE